MEAEKNSALNVKLATDERLQAYGIEAGAIKSLADLKAKLNGTKSDVLSTGDDLKYFKTGFKDQGKIAMAEKVVAEEVAENKINSIYADYESEMKKYDDKIKSLSNLYNDPKFGVQDDKKSKTKKNEGKKKDPLKEQFEASKKFIDDQKDMKRISDEQELAAWLRVQARYKQGSDQWIESEKKIISLRDTLQKNSYDKSLKWIDEQSFKAEEAGKTKLEILKRELSDYERMEKNKILTSEQNLDLTKKISTTRNNIEKEYFADFEKNLNYKRDLEEISVIDEIKSWTNIQSMYKEGSEERMKATVQIHNLTKKLLQDETKLVVNSTKVIETSLDKAKNEAIKRIEEERDTFISSQEEKIKAIDDQIKAMERLYIEEDYERKLAEKQARLALLQSAVGPEGIAERKELQKEIEDMQREHDRDLAKQSLEDQKQQFQDEKSQKEKDYNEQITAAKNHYDELSSEFDKFSGEIEFKAEDLKQIQILKESEKNAEILAQLDQFIAEYQSKMDKVNSISAPSTIAPETGVSEEQQDLARYNANIDKWNNKSSSKEDKAAVHSENEALRKKYGIEKDPGKKLQHFKEGGTVKGIRGQEVPVIAHAGEMYINEQQQSNLFKLLNLKMPSLNFSMPNFSFPVASGQNTQQNSRVDISFSGDTYIEDESTARVYWSERDNFIRRVQTRGGGKG
ncbi:hypothetical protein D3C74_236110 [compost metagenome]